ncbi:hypothetical protein [Streptomyces collinus]|uniref:hypothetical protein n=1 Tax=Streptomyces collinus TaxID=42684 RepID=UPI0033C708D1
MSTVTQVAVESATAQRVATFSRPRRHRTIGTAALGVRVSQLPGGVQRGVE